MAKKLLDILKTQPSKKIILPNQSGYTPHKRELGQKELIAMHKVQDPGEPYDNDFTGRVKTFDRTANRYGHDNVDNNDVDVSMEVGDTGLKSEELELQLAQFIEENDLYEENEDIIMEAFIEQLDELSKALLGRYIKKASKDDRMSGQNFAISKKRGVPRTHSNSKYYWSKRIGNREQGIEKATDRLTKEGKSYRYNDDEDSTKRKEQSFDLRKKKKSLRQIADKIDEENLDEASFHLNPKKIGMWKGWSLSDIISAKTRAKKSGNTTREREAQFAINAKEGKFHAEELELIEKLGPGASLKDYIHDFVHSKNSKFSGDSRKQRIKRALGAYYHKEEYLDESFPIKKQRFLQKKNI